MNISTEEFLKIIESTLQNKANFLMVVSQKRIQSSEIKSVTIKPVKISIGDRINFVYRYSNKDITKNYLFEEAFGLIKKMIFDEFCQVLLKTQKNEYHFSSNKNRAVVKNLKSIDEIQEFDYAHDKIKNRLIDNVNNFYLQELGILDSEWRVKPSMQDKYKQINKYIEIVDGVLKNVVVDRTFSIVDMGSGKGYLTFALYDYLSRKMAQKPIVKGVEIRKELVEKCNSISEKCGFDSLKFVQGNISETELSTIDIIIALHACDTATDDAIARGITKKAKVIICAPCCHKQIRSEIKPIEPLNSITQYGILKERQSEILTDTIRAMILESYGYKTNVFEFIETEHTPKNVIIVGILKEYNTIPLKQIMEKIVELKKLFGINKHHLEKLLSID